MKFAVAYANLFDNELKVEILEGSEWRDALLRHSALDSLRKDHQGYLDAIPKDLGPAKDYFFDSDCLIDVIPVPTHQVIKL